MTLAITILPTEHFFRTDEGIPVRLWTGRTNGGLAVHAFVAAITPAEPGDVTRDARKAHDADLERKLAEIPGPQISRTEIKP